MSVFGGLFGHDKKSARSSGSYPDLPQAPPPLSADGFPEDSWGPDPAPAGELAPAPARQPPAEQLPKAPPPKKRPGAFDKEHYQQTMLALAAGFFGSNGFGDGLSSAARTIAGQNEVARRDSLPQIGGPHNAYEIVTDPETGEHTYRPIPGAEEFVGGEGMGNNGSIASAISMLPPEMRSLAFADVKANPGIYGAKASHLPGEWNDTFGSIAKFGGMGKGGISVQQLMNGQRSEQAEANREVHRTAADQERHERTEIMRSRAARASGRSGGGSRAAPRSAGIVGGYEYRRDPATGNLQKRSVQ